MRKVDENYGDGQPRVKTGSVGPPRKRDKTLATFADNLGIVLEADVLNMDDLSGYPELAGATEKELLILGAYSAGLSQTYIAKGLGESQQAVSKTLKKIDPHKRFSLSREDRRAFITKMWEMRGAEALASITPEKLDESSAIDNARIAKICTDAVAAMTNTKHKDVGGSKVDLVLAQIEMARESGEITDGELS